MRLNSALTALALASVAYADCSALGAGATDSAGPFNLVAADSTGAQSKLTLINFLTVPHTSYYVLSTATGPSPGFPGLTLSSGGIATLPAPPPNQNLSPVHSIGNVAADGTHFPPPPGPWPTFSNTFTPATGLFCSVPDSQGRNVLALLGHTDLFSLCESFMSQTVQVTTALLFNASKSAFGDGNPSYNGSTCKSVTVFLVTE